MKKTFALLALACAASVAYAEDTTYAPITLTPALDQFATSGTTTFTATAYTNALVAPKANIGEGQTWTWTTTFDLSQALTVDTIQAQLFTYTGQGKTQTGNRNGFYTVTIKDVDGNVVAGGSDEADRVSVMYAGYNSASIITPTASYTSTTEGTLTGSGAVVSYDINQVLAAGTYTMELSVFDNNDNGYFVGVKDARVNLSAVPEPATATLSLLALAGLAARRRRK